METRIVYLVIYGLLAITSLISANYLSKFSDDKMLHLVARPILLFNFIFFVFLIVPIIKGETLISVVFVPIFLGLGIIASFLQYYSKKIIMRILINNHKESSSNNREAESNNENEE